MFSHLVGGGKALITDPYFYAVTIPAVLLLGIIVGALLFKLLNAHTVAAIVGIFTLLFLAQRLVFPPKPDSPLPPR